MDFGVSLPNTGPQTREQVVDRLRTVAQQAEALGFRSLWVGDHIVIPTQVTSEYPYFGKFPQKPDTPYLDPMTVLSYVAACTSTIRLGTGVYIIPYRHPMITAKMVSTLDVLSQGRVIFGAGVGWMAEEFALLDAPYHERGAQTDEYLRAIKALWTEEEPSFEGRYHTFSHLRMEPKPVQKPHPPIWIGGHSRNAFRRAGTLGDGWYGHAWWQDPEALPREIQTIKEAAESAGRDPRSLTYAAMAMVKSFEDVLRSLPQYEKAGLNHVVLGFFNFDSARWFDMRERSFEEILRLMEWFAREAGLSREKS